MNKLIRIAFLLCSHGACASNYHQTDTIRTRITGSVSFASAGFAPISAFSFKSPLVTGALSLSKKWFSYEPDIAIGVNGMPWLANNWFRFTVAEKQKLKIRAGVDPFLFFAKDLSSMGEKVIYVQRNVALEASSRLAISGDTFLTPTYRYVFGNDKNALSGHFYSLTGSTSLRLSEKLAIEPAAEIYYFNFTGDFNGWFFGLRTVLRHSKLPLQVSSQTVFRISTDYDSSLFNWNAGLAYTF